MFKANYHTHAKYCKHGEGEIYKYVEEAIKAGIQELGFTCHIPFEQSFLDSNYYKDIMINANKNDEKIQLGRESRMTHSEIDSYLEDIKKAQEKYNNISFVRVHDVKSNVRLAALIAKEMKYEKIRLYQLG